MSEPKAITYKEAGSPENWRKICEITGAGIVPLDADGNASIDLTSLSEAKKAQIDRLLNTDAEPQSAPESSDSNKKRGK